MRRSETDLVVLQAALSDPSDDVQSNKPTVYFDGSCPLCSAEIRHYASCDGGDKLRFVDVSSEGADLGGDLACNDAMSRFHVRLPDGTLLSGARAFIAVWATLPRWKGVARLARIPGATAALEVAYRAFLPIRPILSRLAGYLGAGAVQARSNPE